MWELCPRGQNQKLLIVLKPHDLECTVPLLSLSIKATGRPISDSVEEEQVLPPGGSSDMCLQGQEQLLASFFTNNLNLIIQSLWIVKSDHSILTFLHFTYLHLFWGIILS